jgi:hypothetical protein
MELLWDCKFYSSVEGVTTNTKKRVATLIEDRDSTRELGDKHIAKMHRE